MEAFDIGFMSLALYFFAAAGVSFVLCFPTHGVLTFWQVIDRPNARSSHTVPVVRGGGIAVLAAFFLVGGFAMNWGWARSTALIELAGLGLAVVSFIDDWRSLPQSIRFATQAGAALVALVTLWSEKLAGPSPSMPVAIAAIGFLWIVGYTNAFNFMDGINGLAGIQVVTTGVGTALIGLAARENPEHPAIVLSIVLAGAGFGFLPHNFPNARMFLGDVGSAPLGFFLAVVAFWLARDVGWWLLGGFGLLHANFVLDTIVTLARRICRRERWFEPHREHFYQRLVRAGITQRFIAVSEALFQVVVVIVVVIAVKMDWRARIVAVGIVCVFWVAFFSYAEIRFRRRSISGDAP